jgi:hypothetical protein
VASRCRAATFQLAAFLGGGVAAPVWHLAGHRPDHAHGPDGSAITFHVHEGERHGEDDESAPPDAHETGASRVPLEHGHGSLAHFGLALLGAPPAVPLPKPEPGRDAPAVPRVTDVRLFQPSFPLPRPPPPPA